MVTQNELPLNVSIQGYFLDEQGVVLDSLFTGEQLIMEGAAADDNGISTNIAEKVTFIDYPEDRFDRIRPAASMHIVATFTTTGEGAKNVKLLADQGVELSVLPGYYNSNNYPGIILLPAFALSPASFQAACFQSHSIQSWYSPYSSRALRYA